MSRIPRETTQSRACLECLPLRGILLEHHRAVFRFGLLIGCSLPSRQKFYIDTIPSHMARDQSPHRASPPVIPILGTFLPFLR